MSFLPQYTALPVPRIYLLTKDSPTVTHDKILFTTFASCELLHRVYLQDVKVVNENFIMCNDG